MRCIDNTYWEVILLAVRDTWVEHLTMSPSTTGEAHLRKQEKESTFSFLSLPAEIRNHIYTLLQAPKTFFGSPLTTHFDAQVYRPETQAITLVNKQIRHEASAALHNKHTTWAFKVIAHAQGIWDPKTRVRVLARRMMFIKRIELRFDHILIPLHHRLHSVDLVARQGDSAKCRTHCHICEAHGFHETDDFREIRRNMESFGDTFAEMPLLHIVAISWKDGLEGQEEFPAFLHGEKRCYLGCKYPGGVPVLQEIAEYQAMLSKMPEWVRDAIAKRETKTAMNSDRCLLSDTTPEQRRTHYWEQVALVQHAVSEVLQPLLLLPSRCQVERGDISVVDSWFETRVVGRVHVMERGFANALDRLIMMRSAKAKEGKSNEPAARGWIWSLPTR